MFASKDVFLKSGAGGYTISRSVRLRASASAYFNRTPASATNQKTFTFSAWLKRGSLSGDNTFFCARQLSTSTPYFYLSIDNSTNILSLNSNNGTLYTTAVYRDPSAWYHVVYAIDTTQATSSNRIKLYVNGSQVTTFGTATYPSLNADMGVNSTIAHWIGAVTNGIGTISQFFDGYLVEINFIDGQALTPSSFGQYNSYGVWSPLKYTGTYGTNGFYLKFADNSTAAALGTDSSGNSNTWTVNNISVTAGVTYDSMTDVPTLTSATAANYCVMNPNIAGIGSSLITDGNLKISSVGAKTVLGTFGVSSGKWYWEVQVISGGNYNIGIATARVNVGATLGSDAYGWSILDNGNKYNNGTTTAYFAGLSANDYVGVAFDADAGTLVFYKNGTSLGTAFSSLTSGPYFPAATDAVSVMQANFGQRPFAYTAPTGFVALNTYNLSTPTIANGAAYMAATTYTGTGAALTVANTVNSVSFQPDFVWVKGRSGATDHALYDSVRGTTKDLASNTTAAETTQATGLTAFGSTGFTVGALAKMNTSSATYVGWQWLAGAGTSSSNTNGSITSTVSVNATAGFSVVTYTGTGANATVGHGLGVAPSMIITKNRGAVSDWGVYHTSLGNTNYVLLDTTAASAASSTYWNNTSPTSSVFSIGTATPVNVSTNTYVAYCFAAVAGYSAFGSYTGNGSADGPFVYLGFRPRWFLAKLTSSVGGGWHLIDTSRSPTNEVGLGLYPNLSNAESSDFASDILSNGLKIRNTQAELNASGATYIYAAFAENPFKYSLAR